MNLNNNTLSFLKERGAFRNTSSIDYYSNFNTFLHEKIDNLKINDFKIVNNLESAFRAESKNNLLNLHKTSKENHAENLKNLEIQRQKEIERKIKEREERRIEKARKKYEEEQRKLKEKT